MKSNRVIDSGRMTWQQAINWAEKRLAGNCDPHGGTDSLNTTNERYLALFQTATMQEAIGLMRNGWHTGVQTVMATLDMLPAAEDVLPDWSLEAAGAFPCVPAFLSGEPECIWRMQDYRKAEQRLTMVVPGSLPERVAGDTALRYAAAVAAVARMIEANGISVAIIAVTASKSRQNETLYINSVYVREHGEPFDLSKIAFSVHPSFARRISWAWREQQPDVARNIGSDTYGSFDAGAWNMKTLGAHVGDAGIVAVVKHPANFPASGSTATVEEMISCIRADVDSAIAAA